MKEHLFPPYTHTHVCVSNGKKYSFFGIYGVLCFVVTLALRFALLPYCLLQTICRKYTFAMQTRMCKQISKNVNGITILLLQYKYCTDCVQS